MESILFYKLCPTKKQSMALFIYVPHADELIEVPSCQQKFKQLYLRGLPLLSFPVAPYKIH